MSKQVISVKNKNPEDISEIVIAPCVNLSEDLTAELMLKKNYNLIQRHLYKKLMS